MFTIIRLGANGKVEHKSFTDYKETPKTVVLPPRGNFSSLCGTFKKSEFDKVTDHGVLLKERKNIYTLDDSLIEKHIEKLQKYYVTFWQSQIIEINKKIKDILF